jgi:hypothetical protein
MRFNLDQAMMLIQYMMMEKYVTIWILRLKIEEQYLLYKLNKKKVKFV